MNEEGNGVRKKKEEERMYEGRMDGGWYLEDHTAAVEVVGVLEESLGLETEIGRTIHDVLELLSTFKKIVHCAHDNLLGVLEVALDLQHRVSLVGVLVASDESLELWDRQVNVVDGTFPLSTVDVVEALEGLLDEAEGDTLWVVVRAHNSTGQVVAAHDDVAKMLLGFDAHPVSRLGPLRHLSRDKLAELSGSSPLEETKR